MSIHREKAWRSHYPDLQLPQSEYMSDNSLILPLYVPMSDDDIGYVVDALHSILKKA
jgi:dTDP-4-amino-4,6-dideoxygalactose transaminase